MPGIIEFSSHNPASVAEAAVTCRQLTKQFGSGEALVHALNGVDFEAYFGEITLLVGPSGCVKTTMLSIIGGLLNKSAGDMQVLGMNQDQLRGGAAVQFRRKNIGFVFQQYNLLPSLTAAENAAIPLLAAGLPRKHAVEAAARMLDRLSIGARAKAYPNQLSGGQQQRVAIARALVHEPRLLICDEPTAALDEEAGRSVMELLRSAALRPDRAVIVVTHDSRVFDFGDRIARMNDGRVIGVESRTEAAGLSARDSYLRRTYSC